MFDANDIEFKVPELTTGRAENASRIQNLFNSAGALLHTSFTASMSKQYRDVLRKKFLGRADSEFSVGDVKRIQTLINELRELISQIHQIERDHRPCLLKRLEKLQSELRKRMSDVDRLWGLIGDAGLVLAQLGQNAKPIVDRVREIAQIVWDVQIHTVGLPSSTPMKLLEAKDEADRTAS